MSWQRLVLSHSDTSSTPLQFQCLRTCTLGYTGPPTKISALLWHPLSRFGQLALRTEGEKFTCPQTLLQLMGEGQEGSGFHCLQVELRVKSGEGRTHSRSAFESSLIFIIDTTPKP